MAMELRLMAVPAGQAVAVVLAEREALEIRHRHLRLKEIPEAPVLQAETLEAEAVVVLVESAAQVMQPMLALEERVPQIQSLESLDCPQTFLAVEVEVLGLPEARGLAGLESAALVEVLMEVG
jgi:hypothetical protein